MRSKLILSASVRTTLNFRRAKSGIRINGISDMKELKSEISMSRKRRPQKSGGLHSAGLWMLKGGLLGSSVIKIAEIAKVPNTPSAKSKVCARHEKAAHPIRTVNTGWPALNKAQNESARPLHERWSESSASSCSFIFCAKVRLIRSRPVRRKRCSDAWSACTLCAGGLDTQTRSRLFMLSCAATRIVKDLSAMARKSPPKGDVIM